MYTYIVGIIDQTDQYFSEGVKPPTRLTCWGNTGISTRPQLCEDVKSKERLDILQCD